MGSSADAEKAPELKGSDAHTKNEHGQEVSAADLVKDIKSPGVARVEAILSCITLVDRVCIFLGVFLVAYVYGLDGTLRYSYQPTATDDLKSHSLQGTVNVIRAVVAVATQPTAAKIADVFGRVELLMVALVFYVVGTIVEAAAANVATFAGGNALYQIGYTTIILLMEIIIGDITSTRARLVFSYVPALPFIINTWAAGTIAQEVLKATTWRWGIGMWTIIMPVCALPLLISLTLIGRKAKNRGLLANYKSSFELLGFKNLALELFWLLDVIGVFLLVAVFELILMPLTLAGGEDNKWKTAGIITPLVLGVIVLPIFIFWELRAPHPLIPFTRMKDRGVWGPIGIAIFLNFAWTMQGDFLYTVLMVSFNFSVEAATRVSSLYSFVSVIVGPIVGIVVYAVRRLKIFIIAGTCLFMVAFGMLIHYRGHTSDSSRAGLIGAQVVLGFAGGLFPYAAQASLQVAVKHEQLAIMTGIYLASYNVGSALGNTVSTSMWTQVLPGQLNQNLNSMNASLGAYAYSSPLTYIVDYPVGTPERTAMVSAYAHIQRLLTITGLCLCVPLIFFAFMLRNPKLTDEQSLVKDVDSETESSAAETDRR